VPGYESASRLPLAAPAGSIASSPYASGGNAFLASGRPLSVAATGPFAGLLDGGLIGASGQTLWASWLVRRDTSGRSEVALHPDSITTRTDGARVAVFAQNERWQLLAGGTTVDTGVAATPGQTFFMVLRLDFAATDTATLYIGPAPGLAPGAHQARVQNIGDARFRSLHWFPGNGSGNGSLDEIRLGTSYAAVAPTVESAPSLVLAPGPVTVRSGSPLRLAADLAGSNLAVAWTRAGQPLADTGPLLWRDPFLRADAGAHAFAATNRLGAASAPAFAVSAEGYTLAEWRALYPDNGDGVPDVLKFALGLSPTGRDALPRFEWVTVGSARYPALRTTLARDANDVGVVLEGSPDLQQWTTLARYRAPDVWVAGAGHQVSRVAVPGRPGVDEVLVRAPSAEPRYFLRVRAEPPAE
jgi:hypothetical protein